jgi:hypothetical protein
MAAVAMALTVAALERAAADTTLRGLGHTLALFILLMGMEHIRRRQLPSASTLTTDAPEASADPLRLNG